MNADTYELKTILALERRYLIPTFQRDYEWTEDGQWALLFDDLEAVATRLEEARRIAETVGHPVTKADRQVTPHFLGAIVLDLLPSSAGSLDVRAVIDGQQRLTTIQLLIRGILDVLVETGSSRVSQVRRLIQNPADVVSRDDDRYKLWPRRRDRETWRHAMADASSPASGHLYFKGRHFFREQARDAMRPSDGRDRSDVVVDALLSLFKLVVIDLEDNDDAQVIFEVLNGRQTPLSAADLVKNLLFLRAELVDEAQLETLYDRYWAHFDDQWWREEIGRGHAARGRRDVLLSAWLTAAASTEVSVGHLYREVRRYLEVGDRKTADILADLERSATAFRDISEAGTKLPKRMADAYSRVDRLGVTTALPLLVWLRTLPPEHLTPEDHLKCVVSVESWVMRRALVGANTRGYGQRFVEVLKTAQSAVQSGESIADAIDKRLLDAGDNLAWPSDGELESAFVNRPIYGVVNQERIRMILGALDDELHRVHKKGEHPTFNYDALQIEHILPQQWRPHWSVVASDQNARAFLEQVRDRAKNTIGNLTLVTGPLNGPMSNGPWSDKRTALAAHSNLRLNADVVMLDAWDEAAIQARAARLAAAAFRIWPRPASESSAVGPTARRPIAASRSTARRSKDSYEGHPIREDLGRIVAAFDRLAPQGLRTFGTANRYRLIRPPEWPGSVKVHYEFIHAHGVIGAELHLENAAAARLAPVLRTLAGTPIGPERGPLVWDPKWAHDKGRLAARFDPSANPDLIAKTMLDLIELTRARVSDALAPT